MNDYNKILKEKGIIGFVPGGDSMWPTLKNAEQSVIVEQLNENDELKVNDVILYIRKNGQYVLHRIVGVENDSFILCGDSQFNDEYGITRDMIIGKLKGYYKGKKYIDASNKKSYRTALYLRKHLRIKKFAVRVHYYLKRFKGKKFEKK